MFVKVSISKVFADGNLIRIMGILVFAGMLVSLLTHSLTLLSVIASDFAIRTFTYQSTPFLFISKKVAEYFKLKPKPVFAAPKRFTAGLFLALTLAVIGCFLLEMNSTATIIGLVFMLFSAREAIFKVSLGYYLYDWFGAIMTRINY